MKQNQRENGKYDMIRYREQFKNTEQHHIQISEDREHITTEMINQIISKFYFQITGNINIEIVKEMYTKSSIIKKKQEILLEFIEII